MRSEFRRKMEAATSKIQQIRKKQKEQDQAGDNSVDDKRLLFLLLVSASFCVTFIPSRKTTLLKKLISDFGPENCDFLIWNMDFCHILFRLLSISN